MTIDEIIKSERIKAEEIKEENTEKPAEEATENKE